MFDVDPKHTIGFVGGDGEEMRTIRFGDDFAESDVKFSASSFWREVVGTSFDRPCFKCGKMPTEGELWRIEGAAGNRTEGHSECFAARGL